MLKPIRISEFRGGLDTSDKTIIKDNQLAEATNVFYNQDKNLQTRYGITTFGAPIPDAVKAIHDCDTVAGNGTWVASDDAVTLALDNTTQKRGVGAIGFNVTVATSANNYATVTNSTFTAVDISTVKGSVRFWFKIPVGGLTGLTNLTLKIGSSNVNYYSWITASTDLIEGWNFIKLTYSSATVTGTPNDALIAYGAVVLNYAVTYTNQTGFRLDSIYSYSDTYTEPQMSLKYFESSATGFPRYLLTNVGTTLFLYEETSGEWEAIKTGVTDGARYCMTAYKNIMYLTNGLDNYAAFDGTQVVEKTGANTYKGKYLLLANDVGYILGDPSVPSSLGYTGATPANLDTFPNVLVLDEDSSDGVGTGLINLGPIVLAMKQGKIYKVNTATPSREQIDYSNGFLSQRALVRVENEVFGLNKAGVYTLAQREATIGSIRADALSDDIKQIIDRIEDKTVVSAIYLEKLKNAYFFCDTTGDGIPDTALVFSVLTKKWTTYNNMACNEAVLYKDSTGTERFLVANAINGQCREIETGTDDLGSEIASSIATKDFDFEIPESWKTIEMIEIFGFINDGGQITFSAYVDDEDRTGDVIIDSANFVTSTGSFALSTHPLGTTVVGGGGNTESVTFYPFKARIPMYVTGSRIQIKLRNELLGSQWILTKASIYPVAQPVDVYPSDLIL